MIAVWKYDLEPGLDPVVVQISNLGKPLSVVEQGGGIKLYVLQAADEDGEIVAAEKYEFYVVGTGWELEKTFSPLQCSFLGTVVIGQYVWHAFYKKVR